MEYRVLKQMKYATAKSPTALAAALQSEDYCIQLKRDGANYFLTKDEDGSVHLYKDSISKKTGRLIDKIDNVPHMKEYAEKFFAPKTQVLIEVCYNYEWSGNIPIKHSHSNSKYVNSIMLALPAKATARQTQTIPCEAMVFDALWLDGEWIGDKDFTDRWAAIHDYFASSETPWLSLAETHYSDKDKHLSRWLSAGEEGGVLKLLYSTSKTSAAYGWREIGQTAYRPANTNFKIKQLDTVDCIITEVHMPTKEYTGKDAANHPYKDENGEPINRLYALNLPNSVSIAAWNENDNLINIGRVSSGFTDEDRAALHDWVGGVIEVACMSKDANEYTLRHPRFIRKRDDKIPEDILLNEIFS